MSTSGALRLSIDNFVKFISIAPGSSGEHGVSISSRTSVGSYLEASCTYIRRRQHIYDIYKPLGADIVSYSKHVQSFGSLKGYMLVR